MHNIVVQSKTVFYVETMFIRILNWQKTIIKSIKMIRYLCEVHGDSVLKYSSIHSFIHSASQSFFPKQY